MPENSNFSSILPFNHICDDSFINLLNEDFNLQNAIDISLINNNFIHPEGGSILSHECNYYDISSYNKLNFNKGLNLLHLNIRSLQKHLDSTTDFLSTLNLIHNFPFWGLLKLGWMIIVVHLLLFSLITFN